MRVLQCSSLCSGAFIFVEDIVKHGPARSKNMVFLFSVPFSTRLFRFDYFSIPSSGRNVRNNSIIYRWKISAPLNHEGIAFIGKDNMENIRCWLAEFKIKACRCMSELVRV